MNDTKNQTESKWWSKLLLVGAGISVFLLLVGPQGYKFGGAPLPASLISLLVALVSAALVLVASLAMLIVAARNHLLAERNQLLIAIVVSLIPIILMAPQLMKARSVPPIHDISTDTNEPPIFLAIVPLRKDAPNSLKYELDGSKETLATTQRAAYPDLGPLDTAMSVADAAARAEAVLVDMGLEVVDVNQAAGIVEATATTFWFGFKDDVVVRIRETQQGSKLDLRSVSRVGQSDIGANAARIQTFIANF
ncbi:MAG: DUF1499 domain-containing protein [Pseudomonadales bacterium]